jgi:2-polyprenyl-6-methoxyphenol hydroxylase-like FAD-dependent oxidoreductase
LLFYIHCLVLTLAQTNPVSISQELHEGVLREYLSELGGTVELSTALRSFEQFPDHVVAQIVKTGADGTERTEVAKFDWLVGTDGVHSVVRKQLGLSFLGETKEEEHVLVGDIDVDEGLERGVRSTFDPPRITINVTLVLALLDPTFTNVSLRCPACKIFFG